MQRVHIFITLLAILLAITELAVANGLLQVRHQSPAFIERGASVELTFSVPGINRKDVQEAYLFYRLKGDMGYSQKAAALRSSDFEVSLSVNDKQATSLEYYFTIRLNDGRTITYPTENASADPTRVDIVDPQKSKRQQRIEATGIDYTILSPDPGSTVAQADAVIAITLFYEPADIDTSATSFRMFVDGNEVTETVTASNYFYSYAPDDLSSGTHTASLALEKPDTVLTVASWKFSVLAPNANRGAVVSGETGKGWMPQGNLEISARNQQVGGYANDALSGNVRLSGQKGNISYSAHGLLTTQEDPRLQPQNRFGASLYIGDWLDFEAGHVYPVLNPLTIAGQRIQGVNAGFHGWDDAVNLRLIYGKLRRGIDNLYEPVNVEQQNFQGSQQSVTSYALDIEEGGTFRREVMGGRLGFGGTDKFNIGLNFLKVEDDTSSIRMIDDFNSLMRLNPDLIQGLTAQQRQSLQQNPNQLSVSGNPSPKGNFVAAADVETNLDNNRIQFEADAALSLLNQDISEGTLTQDEAEDLGLTLDSGTETLLDRLSSLIIINENMDALPIRFNQGGTGSAETYLPTSILATQSELGLNYYNNNLKFRYRWVGPSYNSLANTTVRKDIAGFSVSDRIQLFENRIYLTLGYERMHDNVANTKEVTTFTNTYRTNVSWYPIDTTLPRVSVGFMKRNRDNGVARNNPIVAELTGVDEVAAVQNISITDGDTLLTASPRFSDTYQMTASVSQEFSLLGMTHDASLNFSMLNTSSNVFKYGDSQSNSLSLRVVNRYENLPLQTHLGFNLNNTETSSGLTDIQILGASAGGELFLMDNDVSLNASIAFTKNRSESTALLANSNGTPELSADDYYQPDGSSSRSASNSYIISAGGRYDLSQQHAFVLDFRYSNVRNTLATSRNFPNDHLLKARYIFNF
jgi:hypothetical protein